MPIRQELVTQLIRSLGIRRCKGKCALAERLLRGLAQRPTQHHVLFCPGMNFTAMRAGEFLRVHFGLGRRTLVRELELFWPSGTHQVLKNVTVAQVLTVREP